MHRSSLAGTRGGERWARAVPPALGPARVRAASLAGLLGFAGAVAPPRAAAQAEPGRGSVACAVPSTLDQDVARLVGRPIAPGELGVVDLARRVEGWTATITLPGGARTVAGRSCEGVLDAAVIVIALSIDPSVLERLPADATVVPGDAAVVPGDVPAAADAPASQAARGTGLTVPATPGPRADPTTGPAGGQPAPVTAPAPARAPTPPSGSIRRRGRAPRTWLLGVSVLGSAGDLPGVGVGAAAGLRARGRTLGLGLGLAYALRRDAATEEVASAGGRFDLAALALELEWHVVRPIALVAGAEVGAFRAEGFGVARTERAFALWLAGRAGVRAELEVSRGWRLGVGLAAAIPLVRQRFLLEQVGVVHRPGPVAGRASVDLLVEI